MEFIKLYDTAIFISPSVLCWQVEISQIGVKIKYCVHLLNLQNLIHDMWPKNLSLFIPPYKEPKLVYTSVHHFKSTTQHNPPPVFG